MAGKPPYFPLYIKDFAADSRVESMTTEEVGAYILLLCKAWHEQPPATLPNDDSILARWARLDHESWKRCRSAVLACFALKQGRWHQGRLREEWDKIARVLHAKSRGGKTRQMQLKSRPPPGVLRTPNSSPGLRAFGSGSGSQDENNCQKENCAEAARDFALTAAGLAQEFCLLSRCPSLREKYEPTATEGIEDLIRRGIDPLEIQAKIRDPTRPRTQFQWEFFAYWRPGNGTARENMGSVSRVMPEPGKYTNLAKVIRGSSDQR